MAQRPKVAAFDITGDTLRAVAERLAGAPPTS
jgi:hypothetical protein